MESKIDHPSLRRHVASMCTKLWKELRLLLTLDRVHLEQKLQVGIQIALFKALYKRRCRSLIGWFEVCEAKLIRIELVQDSMDNRETLLVA